MKLEPWVAFIDMLGYGEINASIKNDQEANNFIEFMKQNESFFHTNPEVEQSYKNSSHFDLYEYYEIQTICISDSLIINYKPKKIQSAITEDKRMMHSANALFIIMIRLQQFIFHCIKKHKILIRGGISNKYCLIQGNYAVGEGVIEAYHNESKIAKYPRIVLNRAITDNSRLINSFNLISSYVYKTNSLLKKDSNEIYYLDYIKYITLLAHTTMNVHKQKSDVILDYLQTYKDCITFKLEEIDVKINTRPNNISQLHDIKEKIIWLKDYFNDCLQKNYPNFKIEY